MYISNEMYSMHINTQHTHTTFFSFIIIIIITIIIIINIVSYRIVVDPGQQGRTPIAAYPGILFSKRHIIIIIIMVIPNELWLLCAS